MILFSVSITNTGDKYVIVISDIIDSILVADINEEIDDRVIDTPRHRVHSGRDEIGGVDLKLCK